MSWEKVKLGDIAEFANGINFGKEAYGKGVKFIGVSDFKNRFSPEYDLLDEVKEEVVRKSDYLHSGDIVFVRSNGNKELVGRCMLVDTLQDRVTYSGFCIRARIKDTSKHNPVFWTYHFKNMSFRKAMSGNAIGANIQNLSQWRLSDYEAIVPDLKTQHRIAEILSTYDNLIENNRKQIVLLEEAAQRLYREYFVDLRFPGHEDVKVIDGVPEGWRKEPICNIVSYDIGGGWGEDCIKEKNEKGAFVIRGTDLSGLTHGDISSIPYRYHTESNLSSRKLQDGDIVFEVSGGSKIEGVARTILIKKELLEIYKSPVMCASFCKLVRLADVSLVQYMYDTFQYLRSSGKTVEFDKRSASSIVNYRWKDFLSQQNVLIPPSMVLNAYNGLAESYYCHIINRSKQIETLKQARDRLLPKLMSGEITV